MLVHNIQLAARVNIIVMSAILNENTINVEMVLTVHENII